MNTYEINSQAASNNKENCSGKDIKIYESGKANICHLLRVFSSGSFLGRLLYSVVLLSHLRKPGMTKKETQPKVHETIFN